MAEKQREKEYLEGSPVVKKRREFAQDFRRG